MRDFRNLKVWEKSHLLTLAIYKATKAFPDEEKYGLTSQIRRAAASIPANIAEGCGKNTELDLARYMQNAMGSASEVEYHLLLAHDLGYLPNDVYHNLHQNTIEVKHMMAPFINKLLSKS